MCVDRMSRDDADQSGKRSEGTSPDTAAIIRLVECVKTGSDRKRFDAVRELWGFTHGNPANKVAVAQAGAIEPLVNLIKHGTDEEKAMAAGTLGNIVHSNAENQITALRAGAIEVLASLIKGGTNNQKHHALRTLRDLAIGNSECKVVMVQAGTIAPILELVVIGSAKQKEIAIRTLGSLAVGNIENQTAVVEAGALPILANLVAWGTDKQRECAVIALRDLFIGNVQTKQLGGECDVIKPLANLLTSGADELKHLVLRTLKCLGHQNSHNKAAIVRAGALKELSRLVETGTASQRQGAASVLEMLASITDGADVDAREVIQAQLALLKHGDEHQSVIALDALWHLVHLSDANRATVVESGSLEFIVSLLKDGAEKQRTSAAGVIENLIHGFNNQLAVINANTVYPLKEMLTSGTDLQREIAARALWKLGVRNKLSKAAMLEAGVGESLTDLLVNGSGKQQELAAGALGCLASDAVADKVTRRAVEPLVALVKVGDEKQKDNAVWALWCLVHHSPAHKNAALLADAEEPLRELLVVGTLEQSRNARSVLEHLRRDKPAAAANGFSEPLDAEHANTGAANDATANVDMSGSPERAHAVENDRLADLTSEAEKSIPVEERENGDSQACIDEHRKVDAKRLSHVDSQGQLGATINNGSPESATETMPETIPLGIASVEKRTITVAPDTVSANSSMVAPISTDVLSAGPVIELLSFQSTAKNDQQSTVDVSEVIQTSIVDLAPKADVTEMPVCPDALGPVACVCGADKALLPSAHAEVMRTNIADELREEHSLSASANNFPAGDNEEGKAAPQESLEAQAIDCSNQEPVERENMEDSAIGVVPAIDVSVPPESTAPCDSDVTKLVESPLAADLHADKSIVSAVPIENHIALQGGLADATAADNTPVANGELDKKVSGGDWQQERPLAEIPNHKILVRDSSENGVAEMRTRVLQRKIFGLYTDNRKDEADQCFEELKKLAEAEHTRLIKMLPNIVDKYRDLHLLLHMSSDIKEPMQQGMPAWLEKQASQEQVQYLLARATYWQPWFETFMNSIVMDVGSVVDATDLDAVLTNFGLGLCSLEVPSWLFQEGPLPCCGLYVETGIHNGKPFFKKQDSDLLLYYDKNGYEWAIGTTLNSGSRFLKLPDELGVRRPKPLPGADWRKVDATDNDLHVVVTETTSRINLRRLLEDCLQRQWDDLPEQHCLSKQPHVAKVHIKPKQDFASVLDKAKKHPISSMSDLNCATILVNTPAVAYFVYRLIALRIEALGGTCSCVSNDFNFDNLVSEPPYIRLNLQLKEHVFEVMLTFEDVFDAQTAIHQFQSISCASSVPEVLQPVFRPDDNEMIV